MTISLSQPTAARSSLLRATASEVPGDLSSTRRNGAGGARLSATATYASSSTHISRPLAVAAASRVLFCSVGSEVEPAMQQLQSEQPRTLIAA